MFGFVQLDFAGRLGLTDGRYLARDDGATDRVLTIETLGAPHPGRRRRRKAKPVEAGAELDDVPVTRVTVIDGEPFADEGAASWLHEIAADSDRRADRVKAAVRLLNRALHALSVAAEDPLVADVGASRALAVRIGYGTGDELAAGRWTEARQLPPPPHARREDIDPQDRVARVLGGREAPSPGEALLLRARLDLDQGRPAEALHQARAAAEALKADPPEADKAAESLRRRISELEAKAIRALEARGR